MRPEIREFEPLPPLLPELFKGGALREEMGAEERKKIGLFEEELKTTLKESDTIESALEKIVKAALAIEFGPALLKSRGTKAMVETILRGIRGDASLRKQALVIISQTLEKRKAEIH